MVQRIGNAGGESGGNARCGNPGPAAEDRVKEIEYLHPVYGGIAGSENEHVPRSRHLAFRVFLCAGQAHTFIGGQQGPGGLRDAGGARRAPLAAGDGHFFSTTVVWPVIFDSSSAVSGSLGA